MEGEKTESRYVKAEEVGTGANGTVYRAYDKKLNRYVAVKRIVRNEKWAWKEAEVLKKLKHLSIPAIYDVLKEKDSISIVMEYMEGDNLLSVLEEEGGFDEKRAVAIGLQIGECLKYLHNLPEKIIYRDLKPANIIIDTEDRVKLIDFDSAFAEGTDRYDVMRTGTFGYCAPEQFHANESVDVRSDVYGFGTTLYHMLTGKNPSKPPYRIYKIRDINPLISEGLEQIAEKCMAQEKEKRYNNMEEVLEELQAYERKKKKKSCNQKKRYMVEETKNVFLTGKRKGGLFAIFLLSIGMIFFQNEKILQEKFNEYLAETVYAKEEQEETLPLILYNQKREKIIVRDGTFYETDADFYMALPHSVFEKAEGIELTIVCKDWKNGKIMQKAVLLKAK